MWTGMSGSLLQSRWLRAVLVVIVVGVAGWLVRPRASGPLAPLHFTLKDMNGQTVNLADYKGRPLLVNFWATWCAPCKAEIPWLVDLVEKYKAEGFTVLGISTDDTAEDIRAFAAEHKVNYPMFVGAGQDEMLQAWEATSVVPVSWFIRPDGTVAQMAVGIHQQAWFDEQVRALLPAK
jgi:peroxiredoxin